MHRALVSGSEQFIYPYMGKGVQIFTRYLDEYSDKAVYNREILLIQSSGSGKSRLITEATKTNLGIMLNLRDSKGTWVTFL